MVRVHYPREVLGSKGISVHFAYWDLGRNLLQLASQFYMAKKTTSQPSFYVNYATGSIPTGKLGEFLRRYGGGIAAFVIRERVKGGEERFTYALFYQAVTGAYFDIAQLRPPGIKTLLRADSVMAFSQGLVKAHGKQFLTMSLPTLCEENMIVPGELHQRWLQEMRDKGVEDPNPLPEAI